MIYSFHDSCHGFSPVRSCKRPAAKFSFLVSEFEMTSSLRDGNTSKKSCDLVIKHKQFTAYAEPAEHSVEVVNSIGKRN
jgi:hypothetical protein